MRVEITSNALLDPSWQQQVAETRDFCAERNWLFGVQMHNTAPLKQLDRLAALDIPMSFHAPLGGKYMINLAAKDSEPAFESLNDTTKLMRDYGATLAVFHGFFMTDVVIPAFTKLNTDGEGGFVATVGKAFRPELSLDQKGICCDFLDTDEYKDRLPIGPIVSYFLPALDFSF